MPTNEKDEILERAVNRLAEVLASQENELFKEYEISDSVAIFHGDGVVWSRDVFIRDGRTFVCVAGDFLPAEQPGFQRFEKFMTNKERRSVFWQPVPVQQAVPKQSSREILEAKQREWSIKEKS